MTDDQEQQIRLIFLEAVELPSEQWNEFLSKRCPSPEVRKAVEELLSTHSLASDPLEQPALHLLSPSDQPPAASLAEFQIVRELGRGGMGVVYLADDRVLKRQVAIKVLGPDASRAGLAFLRFEREAQAAARLSHPGIVRIFRSGRDEQHAFIAMEYVDGATFRDWWQQITNTPTGAATEKASTSTGIKSRQYIRECARLVAEIAEALSHAHANGIIHRDIKPSNILVDRESHARLTDFGIARIVSDVTLSSDQQISGSFAYMSPEQARVRSNEVDHRSDVFSLGVVLYEALAHVRPFDGPDPQAILAALSKGDPTPIRKLNSAVPVDLAVICHKAIEASLANRYQCAAHLAADLRSFLAGQPILARPPGLVRRTTRFLKFHRYSTVAAIFLLVALVVWQVMVWRSYATITLEVTGEVSRVEAWSLTGNRPTTRVAVSTSPALRLKPGYYRTYVVDPNGVFAELNTPVPKPRETIPLRAQLRPIDEVTRDMVLIPAGEYTVGRSTRLARCGGRATERKAGSLLD